MARILDLEKTNANDKKASSRKRGDDLLKSPIVFFRQWIGEVMTCFIY